MVAEDGAVRSRERPARVDGRAEQGERVHLVVDVRVPALSLAFVASNAARLWWGVVKSPPAKTVVPEAASAKTVPLTLGFQPVAWAVVRSTAPRLSRRKASAVPGVTTPAERKEPPTSTFVSVAASAKTSPPTVGE